MLSKIEHDGREDAYESVLKDVTEWVETGGDVDAILYALIRNAVELAVICADDQGAGNQAEARTRLAEAARGTLLEVTP
jgi:hypothetical protein